MVYFHRRLRKAQPLIRMDLKMRVSLKEFSENEEVLTHVADALEIDFITLRGAAEINKSASNYGGSLVLDVLRNVRDSYTQMIELIESLQAKGYRVMQISPTGQTMRFKREEKE